MEGRHRNATRCSPECVLQDNNRKRGYPPVSDLGPRECLACGADISAKRANAKFCSNLCNSNHKYATDSAAILRGQQEKRDAERALTPRRTCLTCGAEFEPKYRRRYCDDRCRRSFYKAERRAWYQAWASLNPERRAQLNREWREKNPLRVKEHSSARRAREFGNPGFVRFSDREIAGMLNRFGHRCAYCGGSGGSHPLELDHIVPLARGGRHALANIQPACKPCNISKHGRLLIEWKYSGLAPQGAFVI